MTMSKVILPEQVPRRLAHRMALLKRIENQYDMIDTISNPAELSDWLYDHLLALIDLNDERDDPDYRDVLITRVFVSEITLNHTESNKSYATCRIRVDMRGISDPVPIWRAMCIIGITPVRLLWCAPGADFTMATCRLDAERWDCLTVMLVLSQRAE